MAKEVLAVADLRDDAEILHGHDELALRLGGVEGDVDKVGELRLPRPCAALEQLPLALGNRPSPLGVDNLLGVENRRSRPNLVHLGELLALAVLDDRAEAVTAADVLHALHESGVVFLSDLQSLRALEVGVVDHDMRMQDAVLVVVMDDDGNLELPQLARPPLVSEPLGYPIGDEVAKRVDVALVFRIRG